MSSSPFFTSTPMAPEPSIEFIELANRNGNKIDRVDLIVSILEIYEEKYNIFIPKNSSNKGKSILETMNKLLHPVLNIKLDALFENDFNSFIMIISAFFGSNLALVDSENTNKDTWNTDIIEEMDLLSDCQYPLHTLMVMCYAAHSMQKILKKDDFGQEVKTEKFKELKDKQEGIACKLINHLYHKDCNQAKDALEADYQAQFRREDEKDSDDQLNYTNYLKKRFDRSKEVMAIAYEAKAMKFLSQRPCVNLMKIRKTCRKKTSEDCQKHSMKSAKLFRQVKPKPSWRLTMKEKLVFHVGSRVCYVLAFAFMLCRYPNYDEMKDATAIRNVTFFYVLSVLAAQILMTIIKSRDYVVFQTTYGIQPKDGPKTFNQKVRARFHLYHQYFNANSLSFYRMIMIFVLLILEATRFSCFSWERAKKGVNFWYSGWTVIPIALEVLYCTLFAIAVVSSLRLFHSISALGFFVHLIKKMSKTVGMFVLIFLAFWFALAVIYVSISRTLSNSKGTLFYTIFSEGKFEIFGEVRDEDREGTLEGCNVFNRTYLDFFDMHYAEASCLFRTSVIPFLVFVYMFVAGVLLVNLLTAQLTKEYEEESKNSQYYVGYLQYEQLAKIESKLILPPPFSLFYVAVRVFSTFFNCMYFCAKLIEGRSWGSVRGNTDVFSDTGTSIKNFLEIGPDCVCDQLREIIHKYDREEESLDNLLKLKKRLNDFLEERTTEEVKSRAKSRGPSVLGPSVPPRQNEMTTVSSQMVTSTSTDDDPATEVPLYLDN